MTIRIILFGNGGVNRQRALSSIQHQTVRASKIIFTYTLESYRYEHFDGWTTYLNDNDTIREDYIELLTTRYADYDAVIFRMTDGKNVFPALGSEILTVECSPLFACKINGKQTFDSLKTLKHTVSDEVVYYIGGVTVPRSLSELIIKTAKHGELATFRNLIKGGISLLSYPKEYLMNPCVDFWEESLLKAGIKVTRITSVFNVSPYTTLLAFTNMLFDFHRYVIALKNWPMIVINTEPRDSAPKDYFTICMNLAFFSHPCFSHQNILLTYQQIQK